MSFVAVATLDELIPEVPLAVDEHELAIVFHRGEYFAIHNLCSHGHVPLSDGDVEDGSIECFDLRNGRALCLPATEPVNVYPVQIEDQQVLVDLDHPITEFQES